MTQITTNKNSSLNFSSSLTLDKNIEENKKISDLLEGPEKYLGPKTYARVHLDVDISYEEANFIKETFMTEYSLREMSLIPMKVEEMDMQISGEINFESVDTIVTSQLQQIESDQYDRNLMLDIYRNL